MPSEDPALIELADAIIAELSEQYQHKRSTSIAVDRQEILEELTQLRHEMSEIRWNLEERYVSAVTDKIILHSPVSDEEIDLGRFEIRLSYRLRKSSERKYKYSVVALEPNYPLSERGERVQFHPHPHMSGVEVCEGGAVVAITRALNEFRLCDFFLLVNGILNNYNPESPFYRLEEWNRIKCYACVALCTNDELVKCSYCNNMICRWCAARMTCCVCGKVNCGWHRNILQVVQCHRCSKYFCWRHFNGIRRHECVKAMKEEAKARAEGLERLLGEIDMERARIRQAAADGIPMISSEDVYIEPYSYESGPASIAVPTATRERPDHRTPGDITRDLALGETEISTNVPF